MLRFVRGWVRISVTGKAPERFLNLCRNRGLVLWNIQAEDEGYGCSMYQREYEACDYLAEKACVVLTCREMHGLPEYIRRYRYRHAFFAAGMVLLFVIWFSSVHLWKIEITNNLYYTDDQILSSLKEMGIRSGIFKSRVDCETLEQFLRDRFERISWAAASVEGTILKIEIAENYGTLTAVMADTEPADLVAETDGVVDSVVVRKGIAQVKPGDVVTKGQILVSGSVPRHNDELEVTGYAFVHADADVMVQTTVSYEDSVNPDQTTKLYGKGRGSVYYFRINGKWLQISSPFHLLWKATDLGKKISGNADTIGCGFWNLTIPEAGFYLYGYKKEQKEYETVHIWLGESQAKTILQKKIDDFLEELQKNHTVVVENQVRIYYDSVVYRASGSIVLLTPQAGYRTIDFNEYMLSDTE